MMTGSTMHPNVPRGMPFAETVQRCASRYREAWEAQKSDQMKRDELANVGSDFGNAASDAAGDQWKFTEVEEQTPEEYRDFMEDWQKKHGWMRPGQEEYDPLAGKYLGPGEGAKVITRDNLRKKAEEDGASSPSYSVADPSPDESAVERNANRHRAPIGWEADEGQERGGVMGILGGRK